MCYVLLLSTTSNEDLTVHNNELVRFSRDLPSIPEVSNLKYPAAKHELDVARDRLSDREFRFLENHHFTLVAA